MKLTVTTSFAIIVLCALTGVAAPAKAQPAPLSDQEISDAASQKPLNAALQAA